MFGIGGLLAVVTVAADNNTLSDSFYFIATVQLAITVLVSARVNSPDRVVWLSLLFITGCSIVAQLLDGTFGDRPSYQAIPEALFLVVQIVLATGLLFIVSRRLGSEPVSVLVDALIVALGAWFLIWVAFVQPTLDVSTETVLVVAIRGGTLATSALVLFTLAILLFGDSQRSPAVWFVASAIALTLLGDFLYAANDSGRVTLSDRFASAAYIACLFAASAAFWHPSISSLTNKGPLLPKRPIMGRLIVTTLALLVPVVVLALSDPTDNGDRIVRAVSMFVLGAAVTIRVVHSVRANATTQRELIISAQTDSLTGLPNRSLMVTHVTNALIDASAEGRQPTVLFIDVDRFKNINDSLGHQAGDNVLVAVAQRLQHALPQRCIVGRISGDEFVILDASNRSSSEAMLLADRILEAFYEPLSLRQGDVFVSASIGVASYRPEITKNADDLLRHADTAMYRAKDAGRNCVAIFDESMLERVSQRLSVETALYRALERGSRLVHQPIIDIDLEMSSDSGADALGARR